MAALPVSLPFASWNRSCEELVTHSASPAHHIQYMSPDVTANDTDPRLPLHTLATNIFISAVGMTMIIAMVFGNTLVCIAIFRDRSLQQVQNRLLVSLAASDILIGVFVMPLGLAYTVEGRWRFGKFLCELWKACDVGGCTASILNLCVISVDRYLSIRMPLRYGPLRTRRMMGGFIAACWLLSLAICLPPMFGWKTQIQQPGTCMYPTDVPSYVLYSISFSFYLPSSIMIFVYINIYRLAVNRLSRRGPHPKPSNLQLANGATQLNLSRTQLPEEPPPANSSSTGSKNINNNNVILEDGRTALEAEPGKGCREKKLSWMTSVLASRRKSELRAAGAGGSEDAPLHSAADQARDHKLRVQKEKERRAITVLGIVMVSFLACWLPFFGLYPVVALCSHRCHTPVTNFLLQLFTYFGWANSALNPVIYTVFNPDFKAAFRRILRFKS